MTLLQADAGLYPDVPGGQVRLSPLAGPELGALAAEGLHVAGAPVTVDVDRTGTPTVTGLLDTLTVTTAPPPPLTTPPAPPARLIMKLLSRHADTGDNNLWSTWASGRGRHRDPVPAPRGSVQQPQV